MKHKHKCCLINSLLCVFFSFLCCVFFLEAKSYIACGMWHINKTKMHGYIICRWYIVCFFIITVWWVYFHLYQLLVARAVFSILHMFRCDGRESKAHTHTLHTPHTKQIDERKRILSINCKWRYSNTSTSCHRKYIENSNNIIQKFNDILSRMSRCICSSEMSNYNRIGYTCEWETIEFSCSL